VKIRTSAHDEVEPSRDYQAPRRATGVLASRRLSPDDAPLWICVSTLDAGGTIVWDDRHGDDGVYVLDGALAVGDARCDAGGAVIVESHVATTARALRPTRVVHVGAAAAGLPSGGVLGAPEAEAHGVHVVGPRGRFVSGDPRAVHAVWFADGTCPTCRIQLFTVHAGAGVSGGGGHSHSEDEIIYLLDGSIRLGAHRYGVGASLCIPANVRYAVTNGPEGHVFLNYRAGVSEQVYERNSAARLETALARGGHAVDENGAVRAG
jgi:hypothetical protein